MWIDKLIEIYCSKDFLLNITAEAIGVICEIVVVTFIIGKILDRKELQRWKTAFASRARRLLEAHRNMPTAIASMAIAGDINVPYKISMWSASAEERIRDALSLIPPKLNDPGYVAAEQYLEALRHLDEKFSNEEMPLSVLHELNKCAEVLAAATSQPNPNEYLWNEDVLRSLEPQLVDATW